jgi:type I restriction enzyme S subunit
MKLVTGSTVYHIYGSDLKDFEVSFPDISTQIEVIRAISDLDTYVSFLELKNEKLKLQKQGMMQALLTGRIRLT